MNTIKKDGTMVVVAHAAVVWLHGQAHSKLGVDTFDWLGTWFIYVVIIAAPLVAMLLLWTPWQRSGVWLLLGSMLGALFFGGYNHFLAITPDHVAHLPAGEAQMLFIVTAIGMAIVELGGILVAWRARPASKTA